MIDIQLSTNWFYKLLPFGITGAFTLAIGIIVERFKNKLTVLKYSITFREFATSSSTDHWGNIDVYHNGRLTSHLNFVTIELENPSNTDLQDICIDVSCDPKSQFLAWSAFYNEINTPILLESVHYNYYSDVIKRVEHDSQVNSKDGIEYVCPKPLSDELNYVQTNKKFSLPVFNRKTKITIILLVENFNALIPAVTTSILHKSVKLVKKEDSEADLKRVAIWSVSIAYLIFFSGVSLLLYHFSDNMKPVVYTGILGFLYGLIGVSTVLLLKSFRRFFS